MTDDELIDAFESGTLGDFPHELHVRTAWCYLTRHPVLVALPRFRDALQRFAAGKGQPDRYHETITVAYMLMIAERLRDAPGMTWNAFADRNPDLLRRAPSALAAFYPAEVLASPRAKAMFVMPPAET